MRLPSLTYANVMSTVGVFIALGGTSYAVASLPKNSVGEKQLKASAITSEKIRDGAVTAADLAPGAVRSGPRGPRGADGAVGAAGAAGAPAAGAGPAESWRALSFSPGWGNWGGYESGEFRKDQLGVVHLRGLVTRQGAAPVQDEVIAVLPPGYRPKRPRLFSVAAGLTVPGRVDVYPSGQILWYTGERATVNNTSLEGIAFDVD